MEESTRYIYIRSTAILYRNSFVLYYVNYKHIRYTENDYGNRLLLISSICIEDNTCVHGRNLLNNLYKADKVYK